ncbi:hypothetical protein H1R20_g4499, partial [Candolleomyces eurysporus]
MSEGEGMAHISLPTLVLPRDQPAKTTLTIRLTLETGNGGDQGNPVAEHDFGMSSLEPDTATDTPPIRNNERLPAELFAHIFLLVADYKTREQLDSCRLEAFSVFSISHTCRFWRTVALSIQRIWACILQVERDRPELFKLIMSRCDWSPISIVSSIPIILNGSQFAVRAQEIRENWELALNNFESVENVFVRIDYTPFWAQDKFHRVATSRLPNLKSFTVLQDAPEYFGRDPIIGGDPPFRGVPQLETLQLRGRYTLPFMSRPRIFPPSSLKHLTLEHSGAAINHDHRSSLNPSSWLNLLRTLPYLSTLVLYNIVFDPPDVDSNEESEDGTQDPGCVLAHLEILKLVGSAQPCTTLLDSISFPSSCNISLIVMPGPSGNNHSDIFLTVSRCLTSLSLHGTALTLGTKEAIQILVENQDRSIFNFRLQFHGLAHPILPGTLLHFFTVVTLLDSHHPELLKSLRVVMLAIDFEGQDPRSGIRLLRPLFRHFASTRKLHLHGLCSETLQYINAHFETQSPHDSEPLIQYAFPSLTKVVLLVPRWVAWELATMSQDRNRLLKLSNALKLRSNNPEISKLETLVILSRNDEPWDGPIPGGTQAINSRSSFLLFDDSNIASELVFKTYKEMYPQIKEEVYRFGGRPPGLDLVLEHFDEVVIRRF